MTKYKWFTPILFAAATLIAVSAFGDERSFLKTNGYPYGSNTFYSRHVMGERVQTVIVDGTFEGFSRGNRMILRTQSGRQLVLRAPRGLKVDLDSRYYDSQRRQYAYRNDNDRYRDNTYRGNRYGSPYSSLAASDLRRGDYIRVEANPAGRSGLQVRSITLLGSQNNRYYGQQYDRRYDRRNDDTWRRRAEQNRRNYDPYRN